MTTKFNPITGKLDLVNAAETDPVFSAWLAAGNDCPTIVFVSTTGTGNLNLSDGTNWNVSKSIIKMIRVTTTSDDWDLFLYPNDLFNTTGTIKSIQLADSASGNLDIAIDYPYIDEDATKEIHAKFTDNQTGTTNATITIIGEKAK